MRLRSVCRQRGITLIEVILWTAIVAAAAVAAFVFSQKVSVNAAVESEQRQIEDIVKTVDGLFATRSDFADLGTNGAVYLKDHATRTGLKMGTNSSGDPVLLTDIGSSKVVELRAELIPNPATPSVANGYSLRYQGLASDQCTRLVTAVAPITHGVRVGPRGRGPADPSSGVYVVERGNLSKTPDEIAQACANQEEVSLFFLPSRAVAATAVAAPPPLARCNPVHEVQQTACPAGQLGSITQERDGTCTGPNNTMVYTAWTTTDNTCQDPPVAPPTITPPSNPDNCTTITVTRAASCPPGQIGLVTQESVQDTCAGTSTPWTTISSSCQPPPSTGTCSPSTENRTQSCPPGQGGQIVQSRSSTCASPTSTPAWGAWNTVSNTCTSSCSQGGNSCCTVRRETQPGPECPAGTWGSSGQQERFLGCVNSQTQAGAWTPWQDMTSGTCTECPATTNETQTQWVDRVDPCPTGMSGDIKYQAEQVRTRSVSYNCPAGTPALPAPSYTTWGTWADTGARRNVVNSCVVSGSCYELTDYYGGTMDTHDAYFSVNYTVNGVGGGCSATMRDDGPSGFMNCNPGANGVLDLSEWSRVANVGETYTTSGSQSGWGGSRHEFWGWDHHEFTLVNTSCRVSTPTGCGWDVNGNYSPLGIGYPTFWRYEYTESSGANNANISCTGTSGNAFPASCSGGGPGFTVAGTYTNSSALRSILPAAFQWMSHPDNEGAADNSLATPMGASISFDWQVNGTGIGSGTLDRNGACPNDVSCTIPAGTVFNWTVGGNSCTFTQPSATSVATNGFFTANDVTAPTTGSASFSCNPGGHVVDPSSYSAGQDTNCDPPSPRWPDTDQDSAVNRFCDGAPAGVSGTVSWCPSPQVEASIHVVCGSSAPTMSVTPRAGATCTAPAACTAGAGPTVIRNSSEVTDGSDAVADTFSGNTADWNIIVAGGISCTAAAEGRLLAVMQGGPVDTIEGTVFICQGGNFRELWSQDYWGGWNNVSVTSTGATVMGIASGYHADPGVIPSLYRPRSPISNTAGLSDWDDQPGTNKGADYFWFATWVCGGGSTTPPPTSSCSIAAGTVFNWTVAGNSCTYTQSSATTIDNNSFLTAVDNVAPATGRAEFSCVPSGSTSALSPTPRPGATCQVSSVPIYSDTQTCIHDSVGACVAGDVMNNGGQSHGAISHSVTITWNGESRRVKVLQPNGTCPPQPPPSPGAERQCEIPRVSQNFVVGGRQFTVSVRGEGRELILGDPPNYTVRWVITARGERAPAVP